MKRYYDVYLYNIGTDVQLAQEQRKNKTVYCNIRKITGNRAAIIRIIKNANDKILSDSVKVKKI